MNIKQIYQKLNTPENIQKHMINVAILSKEIYDNWIGPKLDEKALLEACLFHDIAKILVFTKLTSEEEKVQQSYIQKYGSDEHQACDKICEEIGISQRALEIIKNNNKGPFIEKARYILESDDYEHKILRYADSRVSSDGIVTLEERSREFFARYPDRQPDPVAEDINNKTEQQIQENTSIDVSVITQEECDKHLSYVINLKV